jgi:hypothetical protein
MKLPLEARRDPSHFHSTSEIYDAAGDFIAATTGRDEVECRQIVDAVNNAVALEARVRELETEVGRLHGKHWYQCERCGGTGNMPAGTYDPAARTYTLPAGKCIDCDGRGGWDQRVSDLESSHGRLLEWLLQIVQGHCISETGNKIIDEAQRLRPAAEAAKEGASR